MQKFILTEDITNFLEEKLDTFVENNLYKSKVATFSVRAYQTENLVDNLEFKDILNQILVFLDLDKKFYHSAFHMISYNTPGWQDKHFHPYDDYSYILYLTTCIKGGSTFFYLDNIIESKPEKNKLILFRGNILHSAMQTEDKKKVAVGALKYLKTGV